MSVNKLLINAIFYNKLVTASSDKLLEAFVKMWMYVNQFDMIVGLFLVGDEYSIIRCH